MEEREIVAIANDVVNRYFGGSVDVREDMVGAAVLGVWKAIKWYDEGKGCEFSTFAYRCARNEIAMYLRGERKWMNMCVVGLEVGEERFESGDEYGVVDSVYDVDRLRSVLTCEERVIFDDVWRGKSQVDIANERGMDINRVRYVFGRMKKKLNKKFIYRNGEVVER